MKHANTRACEARKIHSWALGAIATAGLLAACGGGGGSGNNAAGPLTLSGVAATGAAIANGSITAKCQGASVTGTSGSDGQYNLAVIGGSLPCMLQIASSDVGTLYSVATETSGGKANITPMTDAIVAAALPAGSYVDDVFSPDVPDIKTLLSVDRVQTAQDTVIATVKAVAPTVDFTGVDPLKDVFTAANGSTKGTGQDMLLDLFKVQLSTAGITSAAIRNVVAASPKTDAEKQANPDAKDLGAALSVMLGEPLVANCPSMRVGTYRSIDWGGAEIGTVTLSKNGSALQLKDNHGEVNTLIPSNTAVGDCGFIVSTGVKGAFTTTGAFAWADTSGGSGGFGFPVQPLPSLAALTGNWNLVSLDKGYGERETPHLANWFGKVNISAAGVVSFSPYSGAYSNGVYGYDSAGMTFSANAKDGGDGAYLIEPATCGETDVNAIPCSANGKPQYYQKALVWRAGNGGLMVVFVGYDRGADGKGQTLSSVGVLSKATDWVLPKVGDVTSTNWSVTYAAGPNANGVYTRSMKYTTAEASSVASVDGSKVQYANAPTVTYDYNALAPGLRHRTDTDTSATAAYDGIQLNTGVGFTVMGRAITGDENKVRYTVTVQRK
jgi:hypothetical protein